MIIMYEYGFQLISFSLNYYYYLRSGNAIHRLHGQSIRTALMDFASAFPHAKVMTTEGDATINADLLA